MGCGCGGGSSSTPNVNKVTTTRTRPAAKKATPRKITPRPPRRRSARLR